MAAIVIKNAQDAEFRLEHRDGDDGITIAGRDLRAYATPGYNASTSGWISSTLTGGAIIERGDNSNGSYVKFADGTMNCWAVHAIVATLGQVDTMGLWTFPHPFAASPAVSFVATGYASSRMNFGGLVNTETCYYGGMSVDGSSYELNNNAWINFLAIGRWK